MPWSTRAKVVLDRESGVARSMGLNSFKIDFSHLNYLFERFRCAASFLIAEYKQTQTQAHIGGNDSRELTDHSSARAHPPDRQGETIAAIVCLSTAASSRRSWRNFHQLEAHNYLAQVRQYINTFAAPSTVWRHSSISPELVSVQSCLPELDGQHLKLVSLARVGLPAGEMICVACCRAILFQSTGALSSSARVWLASLANQSNPIGPVVAIRVQITGHAGLSDRHVGLGQRKCISARCTRRPVNLGPGRLHLSTRRPRRFGGLELGRTLARSLLGSTSKTGRL